MSHQEDTQQRGRSIPGRRDMASPGDLSSGSQTNRERRDNRNENEGAAGGAGAEVIDLTQSPPAVVIDLTESPPAAATFAAGSTITAIPSIIGGLPRLADTVTAGRQQPHMTSVQTQRRPHNPPPLPTLEGLEVEDGFGHVRRRWPSPRAISGQLRHVSTTMTTPTTAAAAATTETMMPAPTNEAVTQRRTRYATRGRNFVDSEGNMVRVAANIPFERSNRYVMPGTNVTVDARHHNPAPFETVDPAWLNQPWQRVVRLVRDGDGTGEPDRGEPDQGGEEYAATRRGRSLGMPNPAVGLLGQGVGQQPGQPPHSSDVGFGVSLHENALLQQYGGENWEGPHQDVSLPETFAVPAADGHGQDDDQAWFDQYISFPEPHGFDARPIPQQMQTVNTSRPVHQLEQPTFHQQPTVPEPGTNNAHQPDQRNFSEPPQRPLTRFGTDDQVLARDQELRGLINAELQTHAQLLRGVITGLPGMFNLPYDAHHRLQNEIWVRQTRTFEQQFIATQGIDLAALAAGGYILDADILQRQRQLIELGIRRTNGFPLAPGSPGSEMRLTMIVLEAQLRTLRAWSRVWRERLPRGYLVQAVPGDDGSGLGNEGDGVNAQGISAQEMAEIVAFGEFLEST